MQADDDLSSFKQLVEHAEALQHDVDQAEHHRSADDHDPYDAAVIDFVEFIRKHRSVIRGNASIDIVGRTVGYFYSAHRVEVIGFDGRSRYYDL